MTKRSYTILGVGAVGGYYGARLAEAGHPVRWLARSDADHLRAHGLTVSSPRGDVALDDLEVFGPGEVPPPSDVVVLATKTTGTAAALERLEAAARPGSIVLVLQNGLDVEGPVADALPGRTVLGGMSFMCAGKDGPGHIAHLDYEAVTVGEHAAGGAAAGVTPAVQGVVDDLLGAGVPGEALDDLIAGRWRKLVWNIPFNGLSVVLDAGTDELMADAAALALVRTLMGEVAASAAADGHPAPADVIDVMLERTAKMTPYAPSMKQDFDARRPLELPAIYAAPLAAAARMGRAMPATAALHAELSFLDARNRAGA